MPHMYAAFRYSEWVDSEALAGAIVDAVDDLRRTGYSAHFIGIRPYRGGPDLVCAFKLEAIRA